MSALLIGLSAAAGLVGGALVPLVAYRLSVAVDEPVRGACSSCTKPLPRGVAGWLRLPARCSECHTRLGPPAWLTSVITGVSCGLVAAAIGSDVVLPLYLAGVIFGVLLGAIDIACRRLPHALVLPGIGVATVLFTGVAAVTGDWGALLRALAASAVLGVVFLLLHLIPGGGLGFGDVTLAVLLGLFLGWLGWGTVLLGGLLPWLVNGPVVVVLLLARRIGRKSLLPFGPAMLAGALLSMVGVASLQMLLHR